MPKRKLTARQKRYFGAIRGEIFSANPQALRSRLTSSSSINSAIPTTEDEEDFGDDYYEREDF